MDTETPTWTQPAMPMPAANPDEHLPDCVCNDCVEHVIVERIEDRAA